MSAEGIIDANGNLDGFKKEEETGDDTSFDCDTSAVSFRCAAPINQSVATCVTVYTPKVPIVLEMPNFVVCEQSAPTVAMDDDTQIITKIEKTYYTPERVSKEVLDSERQSFKALCDLPIEHSNWNCIIESLQNVYKFFVHEYAMISKVSLAQIIPAYWCRVFKKLLRHTWIAVDVDFDSLLHSKDESWMQYIADPDLDNISPPGLLMVVLFMDLSIVTNVTDLGYDQMRQCVDDDLLYLIFKYVFSHVQCFDNEKNNARRLRSLCLSIVYNCARNPANRSSYRSNSFLDGIQSLKVEVSFRNKNEKITMEREENSIYVLLMNIFHLTQLALKNTEFQEGVDMQYFQKVQMNAVLSLAHLFEEEVDAMQLSATDEIIMYLQKRISAALVSPNFIDSTFSLEELLNGLEKLAVNEDNQEKMVMDGVLVLMFDVLHYSDLPNAACTAALKVLWQLSFNHASKIQESKRLLDVIRNLKHHKNDDIRKSAEGVMWELEDRVNSEQKKSTSGPQKHIMLSYCWAQQETVKKVASLLKKGGFNLWLDIDRMTRSTIDAMAEAVENADIFLMFMSKNYKESAACQSEAKYARVRKVEIIPIMLEDQWRADGWLGFILGDLLYFKFPQDDEKAFSNKYHELYTEISRFYEKKGLVIPAVENVEICSVDAPSKEAKGKNSHKPGRKLCSPVRIKPKQDNPVEQGTNTLGLDLPKTPSGNSPNTWDEQKVCDWLAQNSIDRSKFCSDLTVDGELLKFLFKLQDQHPILFYKFLEKDLGLKSLEGVSKFVIGLDNLFAD
ncbi:uncharacterized protein LOC130630537 [Hydractinia symbiolongicarpus]|uniref:uncharacterized protein LOC130630537 n=1 Tax=Hydractinia symbiolongicarpus TaxID=13093 RepID=UPI002550453B|nr:uncharacterized protein LOC130630537 [Hydractinia symbiolongicarpus]